MITGKVSRPCLTVPSRVARTAAMASTSTSAPEKFGAGDGAVGEPPHDRLQPVVALMMQMVGLGRGDQDAVDAAREQVGEEAAAAGPEAGEDLGHRALQVAPSHPAPALSACMASISTICRSSRAMCSRKNGLTTYVL